MKYICGFFKGAVSKKAGPKLDQEYRQKASELTNFYNDNNTVITRRPPLEKWELGAGHRFNELENVLDYIKTDNQEFALTKGLSEELAREIIFSSQGVVKDVLSNTPSANRQFSQELTAHAIPVWTSTLTNNSGIYRYELYGEDAYIIHRGDNNTKDILVLATILSPGGSINAGYLHIQLNKIGENNIPYTNAFFGSVLNDRSLPTTSLSTASGITKIYSTSRLDDPSVEEMFNFADGEASLKINDIEYKYSFTSQSFLSESFESFVQSPEGLININLDKLPASAASSELIKPAIRIAALYSNIGSQSDALSAQKYNELIGDWSLDEIKQFQDGDIELTTYDENIPIDPRFNNSTTTIMHDNMKRILARMLPEIEDRLMPVTTVIPVEDGFKVAPDVKLGTDNQQIRSICEELYSDDDIQVWSYPERNPRSYFDDVPTQIGKVSQASSDASKIFSNAEGFIAQDTVPSTTSVIDYRPDKARGTLENYDPQQEEGFRRITASEAESLGTGGMAYPRFAEPSKVTSDSNDTNYSADVQIKEFTDATSSAGQPSKLGSGELIIGKVIFHILPKTWIQRIPYIGGSLYRYALKREFELAQAGAETLGEDNETEESKNLDKLIGDHSPIQAALTSSWGYSIAKGTDEDFTGGAGHGRYSGIGGCFVAMPFSPKWPQDQSKYSRLGIIRDELGIIPFVTKLRDLTGKFFEFGGKVRLQQDIKGSAFSGIKAKLTKARES